MLREVIALCAVFCLMVCLRGVALGAEPHPTACPLTAPWHSATLTSTEYAGRVGEPVFLELVLKPAEIPVGFFVTSLVDVLEAPAGAKGDNRPRILPGFPRIRFMASIPGDYKLAVRVNMVAKSSCAGVKATQLAEREVLLRITEAVSP